MGLTTVTVSNPARKQLEPPIDQGDIGVPWPLGTTNDFTNEVTSGSGYVGNAGTWRAWKYVSRVELEP